MATPEEQTSSQAEFSTYEVDDDPAAAEQNPPPGPTVKQTRGAPAEAAPTKKTTSSAEKAK
jgi:hypothetical protein